MSTRDRDRGAMRARGLLFIAALLTCAACSSVLSETETRGRVPESSDDPAATGPLDPPPELAEPREQPPTQKKLARRSCADLATDTEAILTQYCAGCHANGNRQGNFSVVLDVHAMIARGDVVPEKSAASKIYTLVQSGIMPRGTARPAADEIETLGKWIDCGAADWSAVEEAAAFVGINARLKAMRADLASLQNADRLRMRYLDFSQLSNAGTVPTQIEQYRSVVSLLLNSLSSEAKVVAPVVIGPADLLVRIDLQDYGWDARTWELITSNYPYAVRYDGSASPYDEGSAQAIRDQTGTSVPYIQADWLLSHASRPPLYYQVLNIPANIPQLATSLRVDVNADIAAQRVARAGFNGSGVSSNNRVIERHDQPRDRGAFWLSYDFKSNLDTKNVFAHPLDFQQDGGEGIYHLPNGLQAYFLLDATFTALNKAPTEIVTDPNTEDGAVEAGLSCMGGCHLTRGILVKDDEIRDYMKSSGVADDVRARTEALYLPARAMRALMDADNERYLAAVEQTGFDIRNENAIHERVRAHLGLLDLDQVAGVLGIGSSALRAAVEANPGKFPPEIVTLIRPGGTVYREVLDQRFADIVVALRLGARITAEGPVVVQTPATPAPTPAQAAAVGN